MHRSGLVLVLLCVTSWTTCAANVTTSLTDLEKLLETERFLIQNLEDYANELQTKLNIVRSAVRDMRRENDRSKSDAEAYLANPLNSFSLIRRMQMDWHHWEKFMKKAVGEDQVEILTGKRSDLPSIKVLEEASTAIHRIQTTYNLNASDMAVGLLYHQQYNTSFHAFDCATIGFFLYSQSKYHEAMYWMQTALELYEESDVNKVLQVEKVKLLELYADTMLKQMRTKDALQVIGEALKQQPNNVKLLSKKAQIEMTMKTSSDPPQVHPQSAPSLYERGCRGEFENIVSKMHCVYNTSTTPFLKLAPLKMEIIQLDPYMVLYHDVISDEEIADLKALGRPHLVRAGVLNTSTRRSQKTPGRTAYSVWLKDDASNATLRINQRIADMTGFDLNGSEELLLMNYVLGGHFKLHTDNFNESPAVRMGRAFGDRMATVLFYLSDVEQGGATVFPELETVVYPKKGSAVYWYNLNNRGEGDWKTSHAACPVLVGSKWVCNKWIRERNQMFRRPCYKEKRKVRAKFQKLINV